MDPDRQTLDELRIDRDRVRSRNWPMLLVALLLVAAVAGGIAWWIKRPKPVVVRTFTVSSPMAGRDSTLLNASGYVTPRREATVSSKVTGKVVEVLVEEGMKVEAGQVLARLDSSNVEKSLHLAEAQAESTRKAMEETKANLERAQREHQRLKALAAAKIASASELDRAEADAKSLEARLAREAADVTVAEREVALWKQQLDDTIIRAPFAGIVTTKNAQPGEMISPISAGSGFTRTGICTLVDMSSLEIEVDVSESYINRVQAGQAVEATLDSYPDWHIPAKVIAIIPTADRQKSTVTVRVGFEKLDPRILPQMSVKVAFQAAAEEPAPRHAIRIPKNAVQRQDGRDIVWLARDGRAERRAITLGPESGNEIAVTAGLNGGEQLIVSSSESLVEGRRVAENKR